MKEMGGQSESNMQGQGMNGGGGGGFVMSQGIGSMPMDQGQGNFQGIRGNEGSSVGMNPAPMYDMNHGYGEFRFFFFPV